MKLGYSSVLGQFVELDGLVDFDINSFGIKTISDPSPAEQKALLVSLKKRPQILAIILRNLIIASPAVESSDFILKDMVRSPSVKIFRETIFTHHRNPKFNKEAFLVFLNACVDNADVLVGGVEKTFFSVMIHQNLSHELWKHLVVSAGRKDYERLFNYALIAACERFEKCIVDDVDSEVQKHISKLLNELIVANKKRGTKITNELIRTPVLIHQQGPEDGSENCFNKVGAEITTEMIKLIYATPFVVRLPTFFNVRLSKFN